MAGPRRTLGNPRAAADAAHTMPEGSKGGPIVRTMARGLTDAARGAAAVTASLARHATWYLRYRVDGNSRAQRAERDRERG
jgi:hypothetical protein